MIYSDESIIKSIPNSLLKLIEKTPEQKKNSLEKAVKLYCLQKISHPSHIQYSKSLTELTEEIPNTVLVILNSLIASNQNPVALRLLLTLPKEIFSNILFSEAFCNCIPSDHLPYEQLDKIKEISIYILKKFKSFY